MFNLFNHFGHRVYDIHCHGNIIVYIYTEFVSKPLLFTILCKNAQCLHLASLLLKQFIVLFMEWPHKLQLSVSQQPRFFFLKKRPDT